MHVYCLNHHNSNTVNYILSTYTSLVLTSLFYVDFPQIKGAFVHICLYLQMHEYASRTQACSIQVCILTYYISYTEIYRNV